MAGKAAGDLNFSGSHRPLTETRDRSTTSPSVDTLTTGEKPKRIHDPPVCKTPKKNHHDSSRCSCPRLPSRTRSPSPPTPRSRPVPWSREQRHSSSRCGSAPTPTPRPSRSSRSPGAPGATETIFEGWFFEKNLYSNIRRLVQSKVQNLHEKNWTDI